MSFTENNVAYYQAMEKCPHVVETESPPSLYFDFCQQNAWQAAQRIATYWTLRVKHFGEERAFLPLSQALDKGAKECLKAGFVSCLPSRPNDDHERPIIVLDRSRLEYVTHKSLDTSDARIHATWWVLHHAVTTASAANETATAKKQDNGENSHVPEAIILVRLHPKTGRFDRKNMSLVRDVLRDALCLKIVGLHLCAICPDKGARRTILDTLVPMSLQRAGEFFAKLPTRVYIGAPEEIGQQLSQAGFAPENIPENLAGAWRFGHEWQSLLRKMSLLLPDDREDSLSNDPDNHDKKKAAIDFNPIDQDSLKKKFIISAEKDQCLASIAKDRKQSSKQAATAAGLSSDSAHRAVLSPLYEEPSAGSVQSDEEDNDDDDDDQLNQQQVSASTAKASSLSSTNEIDDSEKLLARKRRRREQNVVYSRRKRARQKDLAHDLIQKQYDLHQENTRLQREGRRLEKLLQDAERIVRRNACTSLPHEQRQNQQLSDSPSSLLGFQHHFAPSLLFHSSLPVESSFSNFKTGPCPIQVQPSNTVVGNATILGYQGYTPGAHLQQRLQEYQSSHLSRSDYKMSVHDHGLRISSSPSSMIPPSAWSQQLRLPGAFVLPMSLPLVSDAVSARRLLAVPSALTDSSNNSPRHSQLISQQIQQQQRQVEKASSILHQRDQTNSTASQQRGFVDLLRYHINPGSR